MVDLVTYEIFCGLDDGRCPGAFSVGCDIGTTTTTTIETTTTTAEDQTTTSVNAPTNAPTPAPTGCPVGWVESTEGCFLFHNTGNIGHKEDDDIK